MNDETKPPAESDLTLPKALVEALRRVDASGTAGLQTGPGWSALQSGLGIAAVGVNTDSPRAGLKTSGPGATPSEFFAKAQVQIAAARQADIARLDARRRRMRFVLWTTGSLLAAASVALVVSLSLHAPTREPTGDIRDAFALARALRDGAHVSTADDFNRDGSVDANDVRALAMAAVSLKGGR